MLFYEESYDLPKKYDLRLLPVILIVVGILSWKLLYPFYAVLFFLGLIIAIALAYRFRSGKVRVTREEIQFEGGAATQPIPTNSIKQLLMAERTRNGFVTSLSSNIASPFNAIVLPMSLSTQSFFLKRGVLIERGDGAPISWVFIPSTNPEQLLKAIQDTKRF